MDSLKKEWGDFTEEEITLNVEKIPMDLLEATTPKGESLVQLSAVDIVNLECFISEEEPRDKKKKGEK
jgi:hypothetical protein